MKKQHSSGILWRILFILAAGLSMVVLELGKHTIPGWILTAFLFGGYYMCRTKCWKNWKTRKKLIAQFCMLVGLGVALWISWPPVRMVPAVRGLSGRTTATIHVAQGDLTGVLTGDGQVEVYAVIPYAKPPVGQLRWKEPQPAEPWEGILKADHFAPMSMQTQNAPIVESLTRIIGYHDYEITLSDNYRVAASKDSLYLNIWKSAGEVDRCPVLVYVHGGSLQTGQPWYQDYSGEGLARKGVIVVNMGYRLGIFGFFCRQRIVRGISERYDR